MEIDLGQHAGGSETFRAQVCVVGAGIAGITLAQALSRQGIEVALFEAGGQGLEARGQNLFAQAQLEGEPHVGTREGRFRAFGGSSLRWGGQLLRMPPRPGAAWPVTAAELAPYQAEAELMLGVDALPFGAAQFFAATGMPPAALLDGLGDVDVSLSKWTPFLRRNLAHSPGRTLLNDERVRVYLHAQVTEILLAEGGERVDAVLVRTPAGASVRFEAEQFVVAAGTVETVRLLLASRTVEKAGVGNRHGQVGKNFHDHLTLPVATLHGEARVSMLRELRPWVFGETVHSVKVEASAAMCERLEMNPVLAHLAIDEPEGSGIAVVRELLTAVQHGGVAAVLRRRAGSIPGAGLEAMRLGWAARVGHRRFVSKGAEVKLQFNVAQDAPSQSKVTLSDAVDEAGMPQAVVDWRVTAKEIATVRAFARELRSRFEAMGLDGVRWAPEVFSDDAALLGMDDARHAMGGACMGVDPATSVVDAELTMHGVANLSIASAAVFPNGSPQLPTLPLMALTLRLARRLAGLVR